MNTPIIDGLKKYILEKNIRFHMPGHKGKDFLSQWTNEPSKLDVTEVPGADNLHDPKGIILESQKLAAKAFGAKKTFFSVNGTTGGIYAAISSVARPGDKVLIQRNCHRSVYNSVVMNSLKAKYIYPGYNKIDVITTGINPKEIEENLKKDNDIVAVVITNPSYYGVCSNIEEIAKIVHNHKKLLVVDEAHGSHFKFSDKLPMTAIEAGADIVIQSTHKTLPAFTQSSMIHVGTDNIDIQRLTNMISMYQTTSPSYLLLSSLDFARAYMENEGQDRLNSIIDHIKKATSYLNSLDGVKVLDSTSINYEDIYDFDITKLLVHVDSIRGADLESLLRSKYNIQLEMSDHYYAVGLCSVFDDVEDIDRLVKAIEDISKELKKSTKNLEKESLDSLGTISRYIEPKIEIPLHEAFHRKKEIVDIHKSTGMISGAFVIPYPPGIPILCPGETITSEIIEYIDFLTTNDIHVLGLLEKNKRKIEVIR